MLLGNPTSPYLRGSTTSRKEISTPEVQRIEEKGSSWTLWVRSSTHWVRSSTLRGGAQHLDISAHPRARFPSSSAGIDLPRGPTPQATINSPVQLSSAYGQHLSTIPDLFGT
ncbi:hypothetical protein U1Q18_016251 [Sarracenia purpurea var. burkii]